MTARCLGVRWSERGLKVREDGDREGAKSITTAIELKWRIDFFAESSTAEMYFASEMQSKIDLGKFEGARNESDFHTHTHTHTRLKDKMQQCFT